MGLSSKDILNPSTDGTTVLDLLGDGKTEKPLITTTKRLFPLPLAVAMGKIGRGPLMMGWGRRTEEASGMESGVTDRDRDVIYVIYNITPTTKGRELGPEC